MALFHAVVRLDHHAARILQFDPDHIEAQKLHEHSHATRQHGSQVRTAHEFFGEVCNALAGIGEVLVVGSKTAQADFRHYVAKHRPQTVPQIAGYETVDQPTDAQLVALARQYFLKHDRMAGRPTPG